MTRMLTAGLTVWVLAAGAAQAQTDDGLTTFERANREAQVLRQQSLAQVRGLLGQVPELIAAQRYVDADIQLRTAKRIVTTGRYLSTEEQTALMAEVSRLDEQLMTARTAYLAAREQAQAAEVAAREAARRESREALDQRRQEAHWSRLKEYQAARKYDLALDEARALQQRNANAEEARRVAEVLRYLADAAPGYNIRVNRFEQGQSTLRDTEDSATPYYDVLRYQAPKVWEELTRRRFAGLLRDQGVTPRSLESADDLQKRVTLEMEQVALKNVLLYLSESTGVPIVVDPHLEADTGKSADAEVVTINVKQIPLEQALNMVLPAEVGWRQEGGQVIVSSREKANPLKVRTYPIRDLVAEVPDFGKTVPHMDLGALLEADGNSNPFSDNDTDVKDDGPPAHERIIQLIKRFVTSSDPRVAPWEDMGGTATVEYFNGMLIVSQTEVGHQKVVALLSKL